MARRRMKKHRERRIMAAAVARTAAERCLPPQPAAAAPFHVHSRSGHRLAFVIATRPPPYSTDSQPALRLLGSLHENAPAFARALACILLIAADDMEAARLTSEIRHQPVANLVAPLVRSFTSALHTLSPNSSVDVHRFPETMQCLAPFVLTNINDVVRYSSIWRSLKRAFGAALAFRDFGATHALVTDVDAFVWKPLSVEAIIEQSRTVWFSDHRGRSPPAMKGDKAALERPPRPDTAGRARSFCSAQPFAAAARSAAWDGPAARMAIGRNWADWEAAVDALDLTPAPDADLSDDPLLVLDVHAFASLWTAVEAFWQAPFADAVLLSLLTPASLYKHCIRGDVLFLETLYRAYLHRHRRLRPGAGGRTNISDGSGGSTGDGSAHYRFQNATAKIASVLPHAAEPLGFAYRPPRLPSAVDAHWCLMPNIGAMHMPCTCPCIWASAADLSVGSCPTSPIATCALKPTCHLRIRYHAAPSGMSRLWMHLNGSAAVRDAIRKVYTQRSAGGDTSGAPFVAFRFPMDEKTEGGAANCTACCEAAELALSLDGSAAAIQIGSMPPEILWRDCAGLHSRVAAGGRTPNITGSGASVAERPRYQSHQGEWFPYF